MEEDAPQQQQQPANSARTASGLGNADAPGSQQGTPAAHQQQAQPQPSGSVQQQGASDATAGAQHGAATPLPRGHNRGELGGGAMARPNVRVGTAAKPQRTASVSTVLPGALNEDDRELPPVSAGSLFGASC